MSYSYTRQNPYLGALVFFVSKDRFIDMAVEDGMAANLEDENQKRHADERGAEVLQQWEERYRTDYTEMTEEIWTAFWWAFLTIIAVALLSIVIAVCFERVGISLPLDHFKVVAFIGSALVGWATLMELGGDFTVWDGKTFPQLAHTVIFKSIFVPGVLLILTSILI